MGYLGSEALFLAFPPSPTHPADFTRRHSGTCSAGRSSLTHKPEEDGCRPSECLPEATGSPPRRTGLRASPRSAWSPDRIASITWTLLRNSESQSPAQTQPIGISISNQSSRLCLSTAKPEENCLQRLWKGLHPAQAARFGGWRHGAGEQEQAER